MLDNRTPLNKKRQGVGLQESPWYNFYMNDSLQNERSRYLPEANRLSVLAATIVLAYVFTRFVNFPTQLLEINLLGIYLPIAINIRTIVGILVAGLTATGADWLFHDHPALRGRQTTPYWILPALSALVLNFPLNQLPFGWQWWSTVAAGGTLLVLILVGEYISINIDDLRQPVAAAFLIAVSFALYLVLAASLRSSGARLYMLLPALAVGAGLVSLRTLHLRMHGEWLVFEAALIAFLVGQVIAALYYWPLSPLSFGALVLGLTYSLNSLFIAMIEERTWRQALLEPSVVLLLSVAIAVWVRQ